MALLQKLGRLAYPQSPAEVRLLAVNPDCLCSRLTCRYYDLDTIKASHIKARVWSLWVSLHCHAHQKGCLPIY